MTKGQAIQQFWSSFGLTAYDATSVPDDAPFPYITYSVRTDSLDNVVTDSASLWYRSYSWKDISEKAEEIRQANYGKIICFAVGRHVPYKGYEYLIKATKYLDTYSEYFAFVTNPQTQYYHKYGCPELNTDTFYYDTINIWKEYGKSQCPYCYGKKNYWKKHLKV